MVDMMNVLRFYPIFAMRAQIDTVEVTVYVGPRVYTRNADKFDGGRYWEALLPMFRLGEAIQRLEVEAIFKIPQSLRPRLQLIALMKNSLSVELDSINRELQMKEANFNSRKKQARYDFIENNKEFSDMGITPRLADLLRKAVERGDSSFYDCVDSISSAGALRQLPDDSLLAAYRLAKRRSTLFRGLTTDFRSLQANAEADK